VSGVTVSKNVVYLVKLRLFFFFFSLLLLGIESPLDSTIVAMFPIFLKIIRTPVSQKLLGDIKTNMEVLGRLRPHLFYSTLCK